MSKTILALCILLPAMTTTTLAQIVPNNSYAEMLTHSNLMMQNSLSQTMSMQAQTKALSNSLGATSEVPTSTATNRASPRSNSNSGSGVAYTPASPDTTFQPAYHIPMTATDFIPVVAGHPAVEQVLRSMPITWLQRAQLRSAFNDIYNRIASGIRPNNVAVAMSHDICMAMMAVDDRVANDLTGDCYHLTAVNDRVAGSPQIAAMSNLQKQYLSDTLIFQGMMIQMLRISGQSDPQAKFQSTQVAHLVLQQLTGSPTGVSF